MLWVDLVPLFSDVIVVASSFASELSFVASPNRTHFPITDRWNMDGEAAANDAIEMSFQKFPNSQNPNHHHDKRINRWSLHHFGDADNRRHHQHQKHQKHQQQHQRQHQNQNHHTHKPKRTGSNTAEWVRHSQRFTENQPKVRRRHEKRWHRNHWQFFGHTDPITSKLHADLEIQSSRMLDGVNNTENVPIHWPVKKEAIMEGDVILGGLMMVHSREDSMMCGPIMPQGGIQALEAMLYTLDKINEDLVLLPNITIGAHILDDCDRDSYGLEMAVDFIKGTSIIIKTSHIEQQ